MRDAERYEKIFSGTKPVADNLKIDLLKLQPWIDEFVPNAGAIDSVAHCLSYGRNPSKNSWEINNNVLVS